MHNQRHAATREVGICQWLWHTVVTEQLVDGAYYRCKVVAMIKDWIAGNVMAR